MITNENIINGIKKTSWHYRLEEFSSGILFSILPIGSRLYTDGAHNAHGAKAIADFLNTEKQKDGMNNYIINGRTKDTDSKGFLAEFKNSITMLCAIRVKMEALSENPDKIAKAGIELGINSISCSSIADSLEKIKLHNQNLLNGDYPLRVIICGSFYLARDFAAESE